MSQPPSQVILPATTVGMKGFSFSLVLSARAVGWESQETYPPFPYIWKPESSERPDLLPQHHIFPHTPGVGVRR